MDSRRILALRLLPLQEMAEDRHMRRPTSDTTDALRVVYANGNVVVMIRGAEPECHNAAHVDVLSELVRDSSR